MIVPDKKTEAFLNKPVSPKRILQLCQAGVLSSSDFLRAAALSRSDKKWEKFILLILRFLSGVSFLSAAFLIVVSKWDFFYRTGGFVLLGVLFVLCAFFRTRSRIADYAGIGLIGLMIFLPDIVFRTNSFLYQGFFLWFVLSFVWAVPSRRAGIWRMTFLLLNIAVCLYGIQFALPSFVSSATVFFVLAAVFNLCCLVAGAFLPLQSFFKKQSGFGFLPLIGMFLFLSAAVAVQCFEISSFNSGDFSFVLCAVCSGSCFYLYFVRAPDRTGYRLTLLFSCVWLCMLTYRGLYAFDFSPDLRFALFCTAVSALIGSASVAECSFADRTKGEKNAA